MIKVLIAATSAAIAVCASQTARPRIVNMRDLTVPAERLPAGCALSPSPSVRVDQSRLVGRWAGFPTNPWIGTDRQLMASVREIVEGPVAFPDGPPLDAKQLFRYLGQLADGVEEAYGAVYMQSDAYPIVVRAIRLAPGEKPSALARPSDARLSRNPGIVRVAIGQIVAIVSGDGECFQAVGAYLKSLAN